MSVASSSVSSGSGDHQGSRSDNHTFQSRALKTADELMRLPRSKAIVFQEGVAAIEVGKIWKG